MRCPDSRREQLVGSIQAISLPQWDFLDTIKAEHVTSEEVQLQVQSIHSKEPSPSQIFEDGLLFYKGRIFLPKLSSLVETIISYVHNNSHEGYQKTLHRITRDFYWAGMRRSVMDFVVMRYLPAS